MTRIAAPAFRPRPPRTLGLAAALLLVPGIARADDLADLLKAASSATGAARLADHPAGIMLRGKADFLGQDATYSLIFDNAGNFVQEITAPVGISTGFDGKTAWVRDLGGEVREEHLGDRSALMLGKTILTGAWLRDPSILNLTLDKDQPDPALRRLTFAYDQGRITGHLDLDSATSLPKQWVINSGHSPQTVTIQSWTDLKGLKLPGLVETTSAGGLKITTRTESVQDAPAFIRSPYQPLLGPPADARFDPSAPAALEVKRAPTGHLLVRPKIDGKELGWFIFDTGAGSSVLNDATAAQLGLKKLGEVPASGVGSTTLAGLYRSSTLTLGPLTIDTPLYIGIDLTFLDPHMGVHIDGIIGYGVLARSIVEADMAGAAISLHDPATFQLQGADWAKLLVYERVPCAQASFEGHTGYFKLDTGAGNSTVTIHAPAVEKFKLLEGRTTSPTVLSGHGGSVPGVAGPLEWFEIAGNRTEKVVATFATTKVAAFADEYTLGNIGGKLLAPFTLVLDYQHSRIGFVPKAGKPAQDAPKPGH